tara:strand:- start:1164 stop:1553 length:390 start_codon:yes stop_codon:yes gene_type:complete
MDEVIIKTEGGELKSVELNKLYKIKFKFGITTLERTGNIIRDNNNFFFELPTQEPGGEVKNPGRYRLSGSNNNLITKIYYAIEPTLIKSIEDVETVGGKHKKKRRKTKRRKKRRKKRTRRRRKSRKRRR